MLIDPADLDPVQTYRLMISVVVPRPIAWVSTASEDGVLNAAPFSYFQALSSNPPMVMIAVGKRRGGAFKDTRANIEATGEFVVNVVSESFGARMVRTSVGYEPHESEFAEVGLEPVASERVTPPRIAGCAVAMECRLDRVLEVGASGVCIGEVLAFHVDDSVLNDDRTVDPARLRPLGRLGGSNYMPLRDVLEITQDGAVSTAHGELLGMWHEFRAKTIALARWLEPEHLTRAVAGGGDTVGRILRHIGACTEYYRLKLDGREDEDEHHPWDPSWTGERIAAELEADTVEFDKAIRVESPRARELLRRAIRHEAWHQGQIAAALRNEVEPMAIWWAGMEPDP